jgi:hypothetical protein
MTYGAYPLFLRDCESVYKHLAQLRQTLSQDELVERFRLLLITGRDYPDPAMAQVVENLVLSPWGKTEFDHVFNRCCYILINYWWSNSGSKQGTVKLVQLLEGWLTASSDQATPVSDCVRRFVQTAQFAAIKDRARAVELADEIAHPAQPVRQHLGRYPFLYPHLLTQWDDSYEGYHAVKAVQREREQQFETELHRYCVAQWRSSSVASPAESSVPAAAVLAQNPTLLDPATLRQTIQAFTAKVHRQRTYQSLADHHRLLLLQAPSVRVAKHRLYDYLTTTLDDRYSQHRFNQWLATQLSQIQSQYDLDSPQRPLMIQICGELVAALLTGPEADTANHLMFVDFNHNLGPTATVGFLLQILLLCRGMMRHQWDVIKGHVSKLFASMFKHYEAVAVGQAEWLIQCLENLQVAFAIHSERTDFSWMFAR